MDSLLLRLNFETRGAFAWALSRSVLRIAPAVWAVEHSNPGHPDSLTLRTLRTCLVTQVWSNPPGIRLAHSINNIYDKTENRGESESALARFAKALARIGSAAYYYEYSEKARLEEEEADRLQAAGLPFKYSEMKNSSDVWVDGNDELFHAENDLTDWLIEARDGAPETDISALLVVAFGAFRNDLARDDASSMPSIPLWVAANPLTAEWNQVATRWRELGGRWNFWINWYQSILDGKPQDWDLLREVALIPDDVWAAGVDAVNEAIVEIAANHQPVGSRGVLRGEPLAAGRVLIVNARVICGQLDTLQVFVRDEIHQLRGLNSLSSRERDTLDERIAKLKLILESVALMIEAFEGELGGNSTALAVVEAQLPMVVEAADEAVKLGGAPEMSASVVSMAATIKYLTEAGTPGNYASGFAFAEMCLGKAKGWLKRQ